MVSAAVLWVVARIVIRRAEPILKGRVVQTLEERFQSKVELDALDVSVDGGIEATGRGLRIYAPADVVAAGATAPVVSVDSFEFHAGLMGLFLKPTHVGTVHVTGLSIDIPPRQMRAEGAPRKRYREKIKIVVDEIVCDDSRLVVGTEKKDKDPKVFELRHIVLHDVGPDTPWPYDATLTNAIPRGDIHAVGTFGPWDTETPGDSSVSGKYTFDHADLYPIKGIGGTLHSVGTFDGRLDKIAVQGTADVPNFSLDTANRPMPLETTFNAVVDGTTGDTYLHRVDAKLGQSQFSCSGAVVNHKGVGHTIDLDVDIPAGRIQDFLELAVKTEPPVLTGIISTREKLDIAPGHESVTHKMSMRGAFTLRRMHFSNAQVQDKVDELSARAQGNPEDAKPGAPAVASQIVGDFTMDHGAFRFARLEYTMPGATVAMTGAYSLDGKTFDFRGKVRTQATLSGMVAAPWKKWLLKAVDPFFRKNGAGAEIPIKVTGTEGAPKFGFDFGGK
jgi:hypothetical protein